MAFIRKPAGLAVSILLGGVLSGASWAANEPARSSVLTQEELGSVSQGPGPASGDLKFQTLQYLSFPKSDVRSQLRPLLTGHIVLQSENTAYDSKLELNGMISPGRMGVSGAGGYHSKVAWYAYVPEAYYGRKLGGSLSDPGWSAYFGRRKHEWSQLDEAWELGLFQPRFRWDCLSPDSQGLSGLFLEYRTDTMELTALGTPLFIPEQGPAYDLKDGSFSTESPCFEPPGSTLEILSKQTNIRYDIKMPPLSKIILNPGAGVNLRLGRQTGAWSRATYAYKPMNQIFIDYDGYLQINKNEAQVQLNPRVTYHHIASLETGFQGEQFSGWLSVLAEHPERADLAWNLTGQQVTQSIAVGPQASYVVSGKGDGASTATLGYMREWGGEAVSEGPLASSGSILESHYAYRDAVSLGWKSKLPAPWGNRWRISSRVRYDLGVDGNFFSTELRYLPSSQFSVGIGADFLSVGPKGNGSATTLISRYRGNDRVYGGVRYVF